MFQDRRLERQERWAPPKGVPEISALDLALRLWKAKFWALGGAIAFALACLVIMPLIKPVYEASAQIYIDPQDLQLLKNDLTPAVSGGDVGVIIAESQVRVMQSASVLRQVVKDLDLTRDEGFGSGGGSFLSSLFGASSQTTVDPTEQAVESLEKNISVVREDRTYIITVYARSSSPTRAAEIANAVVNAYLQVRDTQRTGQANIAADTLDSRLAALQAAVKTHEDAVEKFRNDNNIVDTNGVDLTESRLGQNNANISAAEDAMNKRKVEYDQLHDLLSHPEQFLSSPIATASPDLMRLRGDLERANAQLTTLEVTLGDRHPRILTAKGEVSAARNAINAEMNRLARNANIAYKQAQSDYETAVNALKPLVARVQDIDAARVQLRQLQREADSARAVYEEALTRSRQTREQGLVNTLNAQIITMASTPLRRKSPPSAKVMLLLSIGFGACLGLALGVGYDVLRETRPDLRRERRQRNPAPRRNPVPHADQVRVRSQKDKEAWSLLNMIKENPRPPPRMPYDARRW